MTPEALREFLGEHFAKWQLPDAWAFIEAVPRTSVGKFDKKVLRKQSPTANSRSSWPRPDSQRSIGAGRA